jgi:RHS repeat-associated protein
MHSLLQNKTYAVNLIKKSTSFILALLFLFSLVNTVLAQEEELSEIDSTQVSEEESQVSEQEEISEEETLDLESEELGEEESAMMSSGIVNEDGEVGDSPTVERDHVKSLSVDGNTGVLNYAYQFILPPGRNQTSPDLNLNYSSQSASDKDIFGYGWNISIPSIERTNKLGTDKFFSTTTPSFSSSLVGELVQVGTSSVYKAKVEKGDFLKFTRVGDGWEVLNKQGVKFYYGSASTSRQDNSLNTTQIAKWFLNKIEDTSGNTVTYTYEKHQGMIYPDLIQYTNGTSSSGIYKINFTSTSTTAKLSYDTVFKVSREKVISKIEVLVNDVVTRKYSLRYGDGINEKRDLLLGITESGFEGAAETVLPEVIFSYDGDQLPTWTSSNTMDFPEPLSSNDIGVRFGDLNADGLTDMVRYYKFEDHDGVDIEYVIQRVHINKGNGTWDIDVEWGWDDVNKPFMYKYDAGSGYKYEDLGTRLEDVNGDGMADLVLAFVCYDQCYLGDAMHQTQTNVYINTGEGFEKDTSWSVPAFSTWNQDHHFLSNESSTFVDVNGDGLPDIATSYFSSYTNGSPKANLTSSVLLNTGTTWVSSNRTFPSPMGPKTVGSPAYREFTDMGVRIADVNGDGLVDVLRGYLDDNSSPNLNLSEKIVYLNTGTGWATTSDWQLPVEFINPDYPTYTQGYHIADINGDRLPDLVKAVTHLSDVYDFHLNTGNGWTDKSYELPFFLNEQYRSLSTGKAFIDYDGDSIADAWDLKYTDGTETQTSGGSTYINNAEIPDLLTGVDTAEGGEIDIALNGYLATQPTYSSIGTPVSNPVVVTDIDYDSGFGNIWDESYTYKKGSFYFATSSFRDRQFAGFQEITLTDDASKNKTFYHQGNGNSTTTYETADDVAKIGEVYRTVLTDLSDNTYALVVDKWATSTLNHGAQYVRKTQSTNLNYDGDSDQRATGVTYSFNSQNGNLNSLIEWGEVTASTTGSFTDTGTDKRTTLYTYATNTLAYIIGLPSTEIVNDYADSKVKETKNYYDSQSLGSVVDGNITKKDEWITSSTYRDTEWTYNSFGLPTSQIDPGNYSTTYKYDPYKLFIASSTNPKSQVTHYKYDYSSGKIATTTDANGEVFVTQFDGLDRPVIERIPDPQTGTRVISNEYAYVDTRDAVRMQKTGNLNSTTEQNEYTYFDGFGRPIQTRQEAEDSNTYVVKDSLYGDKGMLLKESLPYFSSGTSKTTATTDNDLYVEYEYDPLGRVVSASTTVGATETAFDQWAETVTDPNANSKKFTYDAFNRLVQVDEYNGTTTYTTTYVWNARNDLTKITDALAHIRNIAYDGLSRRTSLEDLHAVGDATFGTWTYKYDSRSNLASTTDPKGQIVIYTYDQLSRPLTENYQGQAGVEVSYEYDSCTEGVGRLCKSVTSAATSTFTYGHTGLPASETKNIQGITYTTGYEYDRLGNKTLIVYPDSSEVRYTYNKGNKIETIEQKEMGEAFDDVIEDFDYGPHGQITYQLHVNGASTTRMYDENELYRLRRIITTATTTQGMGGGGSELIFPEMMDFLLMESISSSSEELPVEVEEEVLPLVVEDSEIPLATPEETNALSTTTQEVGEVMIPEVVILEVPQEIATTTAVVEEKPQKFSEAKNAKVAKQLYNKSYKEKANIKGKELAKIVTPIKASLPNFDVEVEIQKVEEIEDGVQVFVRGWRNGSPLGFGADGSVEIERIKIINPPILVRREGELHEDLEAALIESVVHTVSVIGQENTSIMIGKVGNTTTTVYPAAGATSPVDGWVRLNLSLGAGQTWSTMRGAATGGLAGVSETSQVYYNNEADNTSGNWRVIQRSPFLFNTASIPDADTITQATLSLYGVSKLNTLNATANQSHLHVVASTPASNSNVTVNDYNDFGTTDFGSVTWTSFSTSSYNNIILNASGRAAISKTSVTKFGTRSGADLDNDQPTWGSTNRVYIEGYYADQTGTTNDPKLIIQHGTTPKAPHSLQAEGLTNPTGVTDTTPELRAKFNDADTGDYAQSYQIQVGTSSSVWTNLKWDSGKTALSSTTGRGIWTPHISYAGTSLTPLTTYYWRIKFWDSLDFGGAWSTTTASFSLALPPNATPTVPILLETEALTNPTNITDQTPEFTAIYKDPDVGDLANFYRIQVSTTTTFTSVKWDSTKTALATTTAGNRSGVLGYGGTTLTPLTTYYWRIKFWDDGGKEGSWSTTTASFSLATPDEPVFSPFIARIQHLTYTYDAVGNITKIVDDSDTQTAATTTYTYDGLDRLVTASTTFASSTGYRRTYTYNALGNITNKSDAGAYLYAGNSGSNYANPHAATSIGGVAYKYDRNGNLASTTGGTVYSWNYINRMTASQVGSSTGTYGYDYAGQRVSKTTDDGVEEITTHYPNNLYEVSEATTTKHIYAGDMLVASVEEDSPAPKIYHNHLDHLNSTNVVTDNIGYSDHILSYYPFGNPRIAFQYGELDQSNQFIGQNYDEESQMSYLNARYYDGGHGQFTSQDPVHLQVGDMKKISELTTAPFKEYLKNPQAFNSYAYARNNPIRFSDPKGLWYGEVSYTAQTGPFAGSYGVRFGFQGEGVDGYYSAGGGAGVFTGFGLGISSGELSGESRLSVSRTVSGAYGAGVQVSREGKFDPQNPLSNGKDPSVSVSIIAGIGGGVSQTYTRTVPLYTNPNRVNLNNLAPSNLNQNTQKVYTQAQLNTLVSILKQVNKILNHRTKPSRGS